MNQCGSNNIHQGLNLGTPSNGHMGLNHHIDYNGQEGLNQGNFYESQKGLNQYTSLGNQDRVNTDLSHQCEHSSAKKLIYDINYCGLEDYYTCNQKGLKRIRM